MAIPPIVRHMILCDGVTRDPNGRPRFDIRGLAHAIVANPPDKFPVLHPELCVYLLLTGGVGHGKYRIAVVASDTGETIMVTPEHDLAHPADRHHVWAAVFRVRQCIFRRPGLYWVEFQQDDMTVCREPLTVR